MSFCSLKRGCHPHLSAQAKHTSCEQKACGRGSPPGSSCSKRSRLERSLGLLSPCRNETKLFHQGHHIVVGVETVHLAIPDLQAKTQPHAVRAPHAWNGSQAQI